MTEDRSGDAADSAEAAGGTTIEGGEAVDEAGAAAVGDARPSERPLARRGRGPKRRELLLPDNHRLAIGPDRTIVHRDAEGAVVASWSPDDPEWARHALRFGLRPVEPTANPHDRHVRASKPPGR